MKSFFFYQENLWNPTSFFFVGTIVYESAKC